MSYNVRMDNDKKTKPQVTSGWYVYIVLCRDNSYYTGITTDIKRRITEHNSSKKGAKYTRNKRPVKLVYQEPAPSRSSAAKREYEIKSLTARGKNHLIFTNQSDQ